MLVVASVRLLFVAIAMASFGGPALFDIPSADLQTNMQHLQHAQHNAQLHPHALQPQRLFAYWLEVVLRQSAAQAPAPAPLTTQPRTFNPASAPQAPGPSAPQAPMPLMQMMTPLTSAHQRTTGMPSFQHGSTERGDAPQTPYFTPAIREQQRREGQ